MGFPVACTHACRLAALLSVAKSSDYTITATITARQGDVKRGPKPAADTPSCCGAAGDLASWQPSQALGNPHLGGVERCSQPNNRPRSFHQDIPPASHYSLTHRQPCRLKLWQINLLADTMALLVAASYRAHVCWCQAKYEANLQPNPKAQNRVPQSSSLHTKEWFVAQTCCKAAASLLITASS